MEGKGILEYWGKKEVEGKEGEQRKRPTQEKHRAEGCSGEVIESQFSSDVPVIHHLSLCIVLLAGHKSVFVELVEIWQ